MQVHDKLTGKPVAGGVNPWARRAMDWATVASLGGVGFAQAAETANVMAAHGIVSTLKSCPEAYKLYKALKRGDTEAAGVLGELNVHLGGIGNEHLLYRPEVRLDETLAEDNSFLRFFDNVLSTGVDTTGYLSGMNQIKAFQQTAIVHMQTDKVFKALKRGVTEAEKVRLADAGIDDRMLKLLQKKVDDGTVTFQANGSVDRLNMDTWDHGLIDDFAVTINRHTNQIIQRNMLGEDAWWMNKTVGKMLTQFRTFPMIAMEKQLARQIRIMDGESYAAFMYGMAFSTGVSLAKAAAYSVGSDKDETKLDVALTMPGMIQNTFQYASAFGPGYDIFRVGANFFGAEWASPYTQSGVSIPSVQVPTRAMSALSSATQAAMYEDKDLTKSNINNLITPVLGNSLPAVLTSNALQTMVDE